MPDSRAGISAYKYTEFCNKSPDIGGWGSVNLTYSLCHHAHNINTGCNKTRNHAIKGVTVRLPN